MNLTKEDYKILLYALDTCETETVSDHDAHTKVRRKIKKMQGMKKNEVPLMLNLTEIETARNIYRKLVDGYLSNTEVEFINEELKNNSIISVSHKLETLSDKVNLPKDNFI